MYGPTGTQLIHVIRDGVKGARALAFDRTGNLYVANEWRGTVTVYAPGKTPGHPKLIHKIEGLHSALALAFGPSGDLFVANHSTSTFSSQAAWHYCGRSQGSHPQTRSW